MTLMKAKKPLALLLALLAALSLLGTTALAAGLPEETIAAQTELCGEDCGHTHEEVFSQTEHTEESLPEPERHGRFQCADLCGAFSGRRKEHHAYRRDHWGHVRRGTFHPIGAQGDLSGRYGCCQERLRELYGMCE